MPSKIGIRLVNKDDLFKTNIDTQLGRSTITALTLQEFVKDSGFGSLLADTSIPGSKISSGLNGSSIIDNTITGNVGVSDVPSKPGKIALSTITGANIFNNSITLNKLPTFTGPSVIGRTSNTSGNLDAISASTNGQILMRLDNALSFGTLTGGSNITITPTAGGGGLTIAATFPSATASVNGSQELPSGIIIKWGELTLTNFNEGSRAITFSTAFPNACFQVTSSLDITGYVTPVGANASTQVLDVTRTGFNCYLQHQAAITGTVGTTCKIRYIALGN
jgi:hypothetical protein